MRILVTGAGGQLGSEFGAIAKQYDQHDFTFLDRSQLDICDVDSIKSTITKHSPDILINCAAYTAVDKAEDEIEEANKINSVAPGLLAEACNKHSCTLIHYSSDYVYHLTSKEPLSEADATAPGGIYAKTKLDGENAVLNNCPKSIVIRTSWVYSSFGNNFVKTMIRLGKVKDSLNIVSDQIGTPTYARDIAETTMAMISELSNPNFTEYGLYNYSNDGVTNWADFAKKIFELEKLTCEVYPISTKEYGAKADRPLWSVLSKQKIRGVFGIKIPHWETSLSKCLQELKKSEH